MPNVGVLQPGSSSPIRAVTKPLTGIVAVGVLVATLFAVGCGGASPTRTPAPSPEAAATPTPGPTLTPSPGHGATSGPTAVSGQTATPAAQAQTESRPVSILLASSTDAVGPGQQLRVDLRVDSQERGISGVQVQIEYDPAIFRVAGAEPGALLGPEPAVAGPIIDEIKGVVDYAAARIGPTQPPTPPGLFATLTFLVLETAPSGSTTFLKITEVKIPDENIREIRDVLTGKELEVKISP